MLHARIVIEQREKHADAFNDGRAQLRVDAHPVVLEPALDRVELRGLVALAIVRLARLYPERDLRGCERVLGVLGPVRPRVVRILGVVPEPRTQGVTEEVLAFVDDHATAGYGEASLPVRNPDAELIRVDDVLIDLEERHVVVQYLMEQDHELDEVRTRLLPERLLASAKQIGHEGGDPVGQRIGIQLVVQRVVAVP